MNKVVLLSCLIVVQVMIRYMQKYIPIIYLKTLKLIQLFNHGWSSKWNEKNNSTDVVFLKLSRCAFLYTLTIEQTNVDVYQSQVPQRKQIQLQNLTLKSPTYMSVLISFSHTLQELSNYSLTIIFLIDKELLFEQLFLVFTY